MPSPVETGVLGMMRMTGYSPPAISRMAAMVSPAAMVTSTKGVSRVARTGAISASMSAIIWGLTPRKIKSALPAMASLSSATRQPSSSASALALSAVRLVRNT